MKKLLGICVFFFTAWVGQPFFTAYWDGPTSATVQWTQQARGCLFRKPLDAPPIFIGCYEKFPATIIVTFGHTPNLDGNYRPIAGDTYILETGGQVYTTSLVARPQYLPII